MNRNEWLAVIAVFSVILVFVVVPAFNRWKLESDKVEYQRWMQSIDKGRNMTGIPIRNPNESFYCGCNKAVFSGICGIFCKMQDSLWQAKLKSL